jgi:hypothetical protein
MKRLTATTALQFLHDAEGEPSSDESENENDASEIEASSDTSTLFELFSENFKLIN